MAVDTAEGVISHVQADFADGRDSQYLTDIGLKVRDRLRKNELTMTHILADRGVLQHVQLRYSRTVEGHRMDTIFGKYKPKIDGFLYNKEKDEYRCPMDKPLPFKGLYPNRDGSVLKCYWAAPRDCKACPMKPRSCRIPNAKKSPKRSMMNNT